MHTPSLQELETTARRIRTKVVEISAKKKIPHLGSSLSCVEMLVAAYWAVLKLEPSSLKDPARDRFILSKGHACTTLYSALAMKGFFPEEWLDQMNAPGGPMVEHPAPFVLPGVEVATGSLGHGLSVGLGMALGAKIQNRKSRVIVAMSDGECNEGSVWEAALLAPKLGLSNVTAVIDFNKWQATGRSKEVTSLAPLREKWTAFGWEAYEVDGHDFTQLIEKMSISHGEKPVAIIANTVKGKGVSFMEDDNNWHYRIPSPVEFELAMKELGAS